LFAKPTEKHSLKNQHNPFSPFGANGIERANNRFLENYEEVEI
jgi:hypothetical protein